jgi:putative membrane protein (TIGR04086 family)
MFELRARPIVIGIAVDNIGTILLGAAYILVKFTTQAIVKGKVPEEDISFTTVDVVVIEVLGILLVVLGGYVAGRIAKTQHIVHGAAVGIGALLVALVLELLVPGESVPLWYTTISFLSVVPAGAIGGYLAVRRARAAGGGRRVIY